MAKIRPIDAKPIEKFDGWLDGTCLVIPKDLIYSAPTLDVAIIRHAHWYEFNVDICGHPLHCSNCHWSDYHIPNNIVENFKICPECGAIMDEEPY